MFFFVDVESPDGEHQIDTLQYLLAEPGGKWLGSGVGEIKYNLFKFKEDQTMQSGVYKFSIAHGMRDDLLLGIEDVGLRIEESS
jgi:gliding motility-associated lipoprotein GldH